MATITNYSTLQTTIADFLNRDDLTAVIPTFIQLAEAQINRDLRHYLMENRATATLSSQFLDRPIDWLETIYLRLTGNGTKRLELVSMSVMADKREAAEDTSGEPAIYAHSEEAFEVYPTPDGDYATELLYYQKVPALSDAAPTNWLLAQYPDIYLYCSLIHSAGYLAEDGRAGTWAQLYAAALNKANTSSDAAKWSGTGLVMNRRGLG